MAVVLRMRSLDESEGGNVLPGWKKRGNIECV